MKANEVRTGMALEMDGQIWMVVNLDHVKPGKGPAYSQVKLKNLQTGNHIEKRLRSSEDVTQATLDKRDMEYLYSDGSGAVFMDNETYDQLNVNEDVLGDVLSYIKPNTVITALVYQGNVMSVQPPPTVDLEVSDTPPGIKGATATNQLKEAILETGLKTRVPPFINNGDVVRISTDTGEYLSRQNG
ncbi:elongation factor P [Mucisphaera calidilacus]|uniref:Elongation factor P n=1 Tax=Mucisphaera calidilacus TaxID=2527982 RepID=A0A518BTE6_9BACT|nr:elongation factor P [Mucisphaera calidilacus]QDU70247.1 Elongation factor P [Mucisphaera calidilacus]